MIFRALGVRMRANLNVPQSKRAAKGIGVVAGAAIRGQFFQLLDVSSAEDDFVGLQREVQTLHNVGHVSAPSFLAVFH